MKLWVDNVCSAPNLSYFTMPSVNLAKEYILYCEKISRPLELIDVGDDYTELLDWLKETNRNYPVHIHSNVLEIFS